MKSSLFALLLIISTATAFATAHPGGEQQAGITSVPSQFSNPGEDAPIQLGEGQTTGTYPERMETVLSAMSAELSEIAQAAREGKISSAQAEYLSMERYYVALTRFQLLRTMYAAPSANGPEESLSPENVPIQAAAGTVAIPSLACAPDIPMQLVEYLQLTSPEIQGLEAQVTEECKQVQPLVEKLQNSRRKLMALKVDGKADDRQVLTLAAEQSQIMKQLIVANSQLETKLYNMLTTEQQQKVNALLRQSLGSEGKQSAR